MEKKFFDASPKEKMKRLRNLCIGQPPNSILLMILLVNRLRLHTLSGRYNLLIGATS